MKKKLLIAALLLVSGPCILSAQSPKKDEIDQKTVIKITEQWEPEPAVVTPGNQDHMVAPPSDAIVLFGGKDLSEWTSGDRPMGWTVKDGILYTGKGGISTKREFGDCQLHVEWMIPVGTKGEGQGRGNSGIFLAGRYEVQVLDSYKNRTYSNGQAGAIYKQHAPLVNAMQPQGHWNTYDIIYTAPTFKEDGSLKTYGRMTVFHNGVLIQNDAIIFGPTQYARLPKYSAHGKAPISIQDHFNHLAFRNIWVREL